MQGAQGQIKRIAYAPGGYTSAVVNTISGDGRVLAGYTDGPARSGWYWSEADGVVILPNLPGYGQMEIHASSFDGSVLVGKCRVSDVTPDETAIMWTSGGGTVDLFGGSPPVSPVTGSTVGDGVAISYDGTVVVVQTNFYAPGAYVWTQLTGMVPLALPPNSFSAYPNRPNCISGDGTLIGGHYNRVVGVQTFPPTLWNVDGTVDQVLTLPVGWSTGTFTSLVEDGSRGAGAQVGLTANMSRNGKTVLTSNVAGAFYFVWDGLGATVDVITAASRINRFPAAGTGTPYRILFNRNSFCQMAANGLIYAVRVGHPISGQTQAGRVTMLPPTYY